VSNMINSDTCPRPTTIAQALELGGEGILVNAIAPGSVIVDGTEGLWGKVKKDEAGGATQVNHAGVREGCTQSSTGGI
jgi:NAD(P)-dependent dehydrogenase (short-subunit alcohol dehydrogenase family)